MTTTIRLPIDTVCWGPGLYGQFCKRSPSHVLLDQESGEWIIKLCKGCFEDLWRLGQLRAGAAAQYRDATQQKS